MLRYFLCSFLFLTLTACQPPPEPEKPKGTLRIKTDPLDVPININGEFRGQSPAGVGETFAVILEEGSYKISSLVEIDPEREQFGEKEIVVTRDTLQSITLNLDERLTEFGEQEKARRAAEAAEKAKAEEEKRQKALAQKRMAAESVIQNLESKMVLIPSGTFRMGAIQKPSRLERDRYVADIWLEARYPVHSVDVKSFYAGKHEVTFSEWDACVTMGGCKKKPNDEGWGRGSRPVMNVSWGDTQIFIKWLSKQTGKKYRLLSEAEWEYMARARTETRYPWGDNIGVNKANCDGCGTQWDDKKTAPVGSFSPNDFGIYDTIGNVAEFVEDCWHKNYKGAPTDGASWTSGGDCEMTVARGGGWHEISEALRTSSRLSYAKSKSGSFKGLGFRIARSN